MARLESCDGRTWRLVSGSANGHGGQMSLTGGEELQESFKAARLQKAAERNLVLQKGEGSTSQ